MGTVNPLAEPGNCRRCECHMPLRFDNSTKQYVHGVSPDAWLCTSPDMTLVRAVEGMTPNYLDRDEQLAFQREIAAGRAYLDNGTVRIGPKSVETP